MSALHARQSLELLVRFMMAGNGSFKQRLSEAYRHEKFGLRRIPANFFPGPLRGRYHSLLDRIDKNEHRRLKNEEKMGLMDELFFLYKDLNNIIEKGE